jgi:predicted kinase
MVQGGNRKGRVMDRRSDICGALEALQAYRRKQLEEAHRREDVSIEMLVGTIGAGKSTYARERAKEGSAVVCHDDIVSMVHGCYRYESFKSLMYYRMMEEVIKVAFVHGYYCVVLDGTHLTRKARARWIEFGMENRYPVCATTFPLEDPEVHARRRFESDPRGRSLYHWTQVAKEQAQKTLHEPVRLDEGFKVIRAHEFPLDARWAPRDPVPTSEFD